MEAPLESRQLGPQTRDAIAGFDRVVQLGESGLIDTCIQPAHNRLEQQPQLRDFFTDLNAAFYFAKQRFVIAPLDDDVVHRHIFSLCLGGSRDLDSATMTHIILAAILSLMPAPSPKWGESQTEFRARMELIAQAVAEASKVAKPTQRRQIVMAMVVTFWGEGRFSPFVQAGQHRGDGGKAICLGGLHQGNLTQEEWLGLAGRDLESTTRCATVTAQRLKNAWRYCHEISPKHSWPEAFVLYGSGRTCRAEETQWKNIFVDRASKWATLTATR